MTNEKVKKLLVTLLVFIFVTINSNSVEASYKGIQFKDMTIDDGLSQSTVEVLFQDSKGYIWIGTNDGLDKYNGYDFKTYKKSEDISTSIASNYILGIKEDLKKNIWVATVNGLSKISGDTDKVTNYFQDESEGSISNNNICDILITKDGKVLIATGDGLNLYNEDSDDFTRILGKGDDLTSQDIYSLDKDEFGNIWIGTYGGLNKINIKEKTVEKFDADIADNIYKVYCDKKGYVWIGTYSGVRKMDINTHEVMSYKHIENDETSLPGDFVTNILRDSNGRVWICTDKGLAEYIENDGTFITYKNELYDRYSLLNDLTFSIIQDSKGLIWVGTYRGISIFNPNNNIEHYKNISSDENSISSSVIHGIYEDKNELLWVGTNSDGVNIIDRKTKKIRHLNRDNGLSSDSINYIIGDDKYIWIGTREGLNRVDLKTREIKKYTIDDGLYSQNIKSLLIDDKGYLWIGTSQGVNILNIEEDRLEDEKNLNSYMKEDKYVETIYQDTEGNYWLGTFKSGSLIKVDRKNKSIENFMPSIVSKDNIAVNNTSVRSIAEDETHMWIGTSYGLYSLDKNNKSLKRYTEKDGLSNNTIYGIIIDSRGNLWMSTNYGISKYNPTKENGFINFNITDGFQSNEFNGGAYFKNKKGEIMFGGINGLNIFNPVEIKSNINFNKVSFDEFVVDKKIYKNIDNLKFRHNQNSINIKYFYPDYTDRNIIYEYKMEGVDSNWNETDNNEVIYKNLAPGKYTFKIKIKNNNYKKSEENSVSFEIAPHILLSPIAFLGYFIILVVMIIYNKQKVKTLDALVEHRTRQLREEMEKSNNLFNQVISLERRKNNYFVNLSHELRTHLNVISTTLQLMLQFNKKDEMMSREKVDYHCNIMMKNSNRLLNLINNIIDTSKIEHGSYKINLEDNDIVSIVEETSLSLKDYIEKKELELIIDPDVEEKIIKCDPYEIERCLVNLIGNARKFTPEGGTITVKLRDCDETVLISVTDTGVGINKENQKNIFDRFNQVIDANSEVKGGSGLGLTITKHIVQMHKGEIFVESEVGKGSTFTIILPASTR